MSEYYFEVDPRDEAGLRALEDIRGAGINHVADAVAQSADHVGSFFVMLRLELAFYLGCLNLRKRLDQKGESNCFPDAVVEDPLALTAQGIYDVCLTLYVKHTVIANDVNADGRSLVMITGANQGGKSTFLRSLGVAHLMMQSGMFVGAQSFRASVCADVFTHFKREEDVTMDSGKLDEKLGRMSTIAAQIVPNAILLCNESFASTNEREGSEIARQVIRAMLDEQIKIFFVTHLYDLARSLREQHVDSILFLRAQREPDGRRTSKLLEGDPRATSHGKDSDVARFRACSRRVAGACEHHDLGRVGGWAGRGGNPRGCQPALARCGRDGTRRARRRRSTAPGRCRRARRRRGRSRRG